MITVLDAEMKIARILYDLEIATNTIVDRVDLREVDVTAISSYGQEIKVRVEIKMSRPPGAWKLPDTTNSWVCKWCGQPRSNKSDVVWACVARWSRASGESLPCEPKDQPEDYSKIKATFLAELKKAQAGDTSAASRLPELADRLLAAARA